MKKFSVVLYFITSIILCIVAVAFGFIEGRFLFSGDWIIFQTPIVGFFQYFCRFAFACSVLGVAVCGLVFRKKYNFSFISGLILLSASVSAIFASNNIGLYLAIVALMHFCSTTLNFWFNKPAKK